MHSKNGAVHRCKNISKQIQIAAANSWKPGEPVLQYSTSGATSLKKIVTLQHAKFKVLADLSLNYTYSII
jgi:hypothetical protein